MLDLEDSGRQIGKKLLSLLSPNQKKELAQFVRDYEAGDIPADLPYTTHFRGRYFTPLQVDQPLAKTAFMAFCSTSAVSFEVLMDRATTFSFTSSCIYRPPFDDF